MRRQVEAVPVEEYGALLAREAPGVLLEDLIHPRQNPMIAAHVVPFADVVVSVLLTRLIVGKVEGIGVYGASMPRDTSPPMRLL